LDLHTYAIGFPDPEGADAPSIHNEFSYSRLVAEAFHTQHRELVMTAEDYCKTMDRWWQVCCEPHGAPEAVCLYALFERIAGDGHRVAFCGSGPDEVFDGYSHGFKLREIGAEQLAGAYFDRFNAVGGVDLERLMPGVSARAGSGLDRLGIFDMAHLRRVWQLRDDNQRGFFYRLYGMNVIASRQGEYLSAGAKA
jgi:asparagine synthase (glutamine-hydrolysing)